MIVDFKKLAQEIVQPRESQCSVTLPSKVAVTRMISDAELLLFPDHFASQQARGTPVLEDVLERFHEELHRQLCLAFAATGRNGNGSQACEQSLVVASKFVEGLPKLQAMLQADVQAAYDGDPALYSTTEAVLCYPGITAVFCFRLAHELYQMDVPLLPRMIAEHAHSRTGIDIHPGAQIGEQFFIDHGTGVVIGETAIIGNRVRLYQGVTLGAKSFPSDADGQLVKGLPRHPILEDDVVVYSWASVLGRITIGRGSTIGGNVWVTADVPPGSLVTQAQPRQSSFIHGAGI